MGIFGKKKKQDYVTRKEFVSALMMIADDVTKLKRDCNLAKINLVANAKYSRRTMEVLASLVELIRNISSKKELSKKNKVFDNKDFTTKELYNLMLESLD